MIWYAIPGVPENEIPLNFPNSDNAQINLKHIPWKNEDQGPQGDSVKPESSVIMMGTMPTQRKFNLTKTKGKGQRHKRKKSHTILANILIRSSKDATLKAIQNCEN